jgi:hypothetical protein
MKLTSTVAQLGTAAGPRTPRTHGTHCGKALPSWNRWTHMVVHFPSMRGSRDRDRDRDRNIIMVYATQCRRSNGSLSQRFPLSAFQDPSVPGPVAPSHCSMRSMRGVLIFRSRGPSLQVHHGQCLTSMCMAHCTALRQYCATWGPAKIPGPSYSDLVNSCSRGRQQKLEIKSSRDYDHDHDRRDQCCSACVYTETL